MAAVHMGSPLGGDKDKQVVQHYGSGRNWVKAVWISFSVKEKESVKRKSLTHLALVPEEAIFAQT